MSSDCQVSDDPADAFIDIFDEVPEELFLGDEAQQLRTVPAVMREAREVEQAILKHGKAPARLANLPNDDSQNRVALARLIGLDLILRRVHPHAESPTPAPLLPLATRYVRRGHFNTSRESGLLLPRLMKYGAPDHLSDKYELFSVVRVEPNRVERIQFQSFGARGWPTIKGKEDVVVACVPFLETIEDIQLERVDKFGDGRYRLGPNDEARLKRRIDEVITALDRSGATIGVLPEGALSKTLLSQWKLRLAQTYPRSRSSLAMVIVGTGPVTGEDPPRNRAVVLDRQGEHLWEQDKLCDYTLQQGTIRFWELPNLGDGDLKEDIHRGSHLFVAETTLGRIAILICEDLQRCDTRRIVPGDLGVSHILVPVFDRLLEKRRWHKTAAEPYLNWTGSRVAVSNSRVVGNLMSKPSPMSTALGMSPPPGIRGYEVDIGKTDSPIDAACIEMRALGPPP